MASSNETEAAGSKIGDEEITMTQRLREIFDTTDDEDVPQIFAEMQEYIAGRWIETARWIRYEEKADIDGSKWSTPHVATFDGKSLGITQHLVNNGICHFNCDFESVTQIATKMSEDAVESGHLAEENREAFFETINAPHFHFHQLFESGIKEAMKKTALVSSRDVGVKAGADDETRLKNEGKINKALEKKLESNAEAASILTGAVEYLKKPLFVFLRQKSNKEGQKLPLLTEANIPLRYVVVILGPLKHVDMMRECGRVMATALSDFVFQSVARSADTSADLIFGLDNFGDFATVIAPAQWNPKQRIGPPVHIASQHDRRMNIDYEAQLHEEHDSSFHDEPKADPFEVHLPPGLQVTGRPFGGLVSDVKRKLPHYPSDFTDGLSVQCLAAVSFLFFIVLTQMVSFGELMDKFTGKHIGAFESIVSAGINGVLYHLFAGQPLNVISSTAPVAVFEKLNYDICVAYDLNFMEFRFWVGMWTVLILLIIVMFDLSFIVCFITRFTEDNFAALIASIFIYQSFRSMGDIYKQAPVAWPERDLKQGCECLSADWNSSNLTTTTTSSTVNATDCSAFGFNECNAHPDCVIVGDNCPVPDVFFFSMLLFVITFLMASFLKEFRFQPFFSNRFRVRVADFAVAVTVFVMCAVDYFAAYDTAKLDIPDSFKPTLPGRAWITNPFGVNPIWSIPVAVGPAIVASILLFMDHQITTVIVNRKDHLLKKGFGYHLDLFVLAIQILINSIFGLTWLVAATVLAIGHINSLRIESKSAAPGEQRKFLGIREQRVTGIAIFSLIFCSIFMRDILRLVPKAVLYGCFLFMGINVLRGCGNFQRILLFITPIKNHPDLPYLRHVRTWRMHLFTIIQLASFVLLWGLKELPPPFSMAFPVMLVVMVFIRKALDCVFTNEELYYLDDIMPPFKIPRVKDKDKKPKNRKESKTGATSKTNENEQVDEFLLAEKSK